MAILITDFAQHCLLEMMSNSFFNDQVFMPGGLNMMLKDFPWESAALSLNYLDGKLYVCGGSDAGKCFQGTFIKKPNFGKYLLSYNH